MFSLLSDACVTSQYTTYNTLQGCWEHLKINVAQLCEGRGCKAVTCRAAKTFNLVSMGGDQCQNGGSNLEGGDFKLRGGILLQ